MPSGDATVCVIIPAYRMLGALRRALASVAAQTRLPDEVIVVDDASPEPVTEDILALFPALPARIIRHEENQGAAGARNTGVAAAGCEFVAFLDADDEWHPQKLEKQLGFLAGQSEANQVSFTGYRLVHGATGHADDRRVPLRGSPLDTYIWGCNVSLGSTFMGRRDLFNRLGPFDTSLRRFEYWDWVLRSADTHDIAVLSEILAVIHSGAWPSFESVRHSVRVLRRRYVRAIGFHSRTRARIFVSSLQLELSVAAYRAGRHFRATWYFLTVMALYPARDANFWHAFFRRLMLDFCSRLKEIFLPRPSARQI